MIETVAVIIWLVGSVHFVGKLHDHAVKNSLKIGTMGYSIACAWMLFVAVAAPLGVYCLRRAVARAMRDGSLTHA